MFGPSGIVVPGRPVCSVNLDPKFRKDLWDLATDLNLQLVAVINALLALPTPTLPTSIEKRLFIYYGILLNNALEGVTILATHRAYHAVPNMLRSAHEYVARTIYYLRNHAALVSQLQSIWVKLDAILGRAATDPQVKFTLGEWVKEFRATYPAWQRPHDLSTKDMLQNIFKQNAFQKMYDTYYVIPGMTIHGFVEWVPALIYHDGKSTQVTVADPVRTMESFVCHALRIAFTFTWLATTRFSLSDKKAAAIALFRSYHRIKHGLGVMVLSPFLGLKQ